MKQNNYLTKAAVALVALVSFAAQVPAAILNFQQGVDGYTGALDTQIRSAGVQSGGGATDDSGLNPVNADNQDGTPAGPVNALFRFDNIIGAGAGQIPADTMITSATLIFRSTAGNADSDGAISVYRMLTSWDSTITWANSFAGDGVQPDDAEAASTADGTINAAFTNPNNNPALTAQRSVDVTATVQAWIDGSIANNGFVVINAGNNGYRIDSAETAIVTNRPRLRVEFGSCTPPSFTGTGASQPPATTTLSQCGTLSLSAVAVGSEPMSLQWMKDDGTGNYIAIDSTLNPTATNRTLVINNAQVADSGNYKLQAVNCDPPETTLSSTAVVTVNQDDTGPVPVSASVNAARTEVTLSFNEPLQAADGLGADPDKAQDPLKYRIDDLTAGEPLAHYGDRLARLENGTNIVLEIDTTLNTWTEGNRYSVNSGGVPDNCNNAASDPADTPVKAITSFRQGVRGYTGTEDTELNSATPDANLGANEVLVNDTDPQTQQVLLQFSNIFGSGTGQVPVGSIISNATLIINQSDEGSPANVHVMLQSWTEASTWNSFAGGVTNDGVEANSSTNFVIPNQGANGLRRFDVTSMVQAWANNPASNFGWAFLPTGGNGFRWGSSENATEGNRPLLEIDFIEVEAPVGIVTQPQTPININEGDTLNISVTVTGSAPTFVWQKHNGSAFVDIGAPSSQTYSKPGAIASDSGQYRVYVCNEFNCVTSTVSSVTVTQDTTRPTITSGVGAADMVTITLVFSEAVNEAQAETTGNYTASGLTVNSAVLGADNRTVTLTTTARNFHQTYNLSVSGIADRANTPNVMTPTTIPITSDVMRLASFGDTWKYEQALNLDDSGWQNVGYDDTGWLEGPGSFGLEPSTGPSNTLRNAGASIQTPWTVGMNQPTYYVRRTVAVPAHSLAPNVKYDLVHYIDDGALIWVNGVESARLSFTNIPTGPIYYTNLSAGAGTNMGGEITRATNQLTLNPGALNTIAVEIHQQSTNSSDVVFGAELYARFEVARPTMTIVNNQNGTVTISWNPAVGSLKESSNLVNWNTSGNQANGAPRAATGNLFYRVEQ